MTHLINPTGRKTQAHIVTLDGNGLKLYFSYNTLIAVSDPSKHMFARLANLWGPTTGRHFSELNCSHFPIVDKLPLINGTTSKWQKAKA